MKSPIHAKTCTLFLLLSIILLAALWAPCTADDAVSTGPMLQEVRVGPADKFTSFGYFGTCPESPDGSRLIYVVFDEPPLRRKVRGKLYICDRDLKEHRLLCDIDVRIDNHNAAFQQWIDNDSVAYSSPGGVQGAAYVVNADTGAVEHGPFRGAYVGPNSHAGRILLCVRYQPSNVGSPGLYELNTKTGRVRQVFAIDYFKQYYDQHGWLGDRDPNTWKIGHAKYSTDGSHIAFVIIPPGKGRKFHLFTCKPDATDLIYFGPDKPMHYGWYDENTLWGSDSEVDDGSPDDKCIKRWTRDKTLVEVLAGRGCHLAVSADRQWFAGESWYHSDPVQLFLYRTGQNQPKAMIFETHAAKQVWGYNGHVNPAFSRDGTRLYYSRALNDELKQAYYCDVSSLVRP